MPLHLRATRGLLTDREAGRSLQSLLRRPLLVGVAGVLTVLVTTLALTSLVLFVLDPRDSRTHDALDALQEGHVAMVDQETGLRGFLVTRDPQFLQPYVQGSAELRRLDRRLADAAAGDPQLRDGVARLVAAEDAWISGWARPVQSSQPAVGDSAALSALLLQGKRLFDAYRVAQADVAGQVRVRQDLLATQQRGLLLLGAGVTLGMSALGAVAVSRANRRMAEELLPPVLQVRRTLADLAGGRLDSRAAATGPVELRQIIGDVNALGATLAERSAAVGVREVELLAAWDEAERAGQAKTAFLATMSHEIRTPLNAVLGLTDLLLTTELDSTQRSHLETVSRSGDSLLTLINDVLDFSKIEAGELDLEVAPFDLRDLVYDVAQLFAAQAAGKGLDLVVDVDHGCPPRVVGDGPRLRQVVTNLVSNAIKFTATGQVLLTVTGALAGGGFDCRIAVTDSGIGIPVHRRDRLFRSFSQVDSSTTRNYGGTGLGLAISLRIAEAMDGTIEVDSAEGTGSTFTVAARLDVGPVVEAAAVDRLLSGRRLLLVDDNATNLRILVHQLGRAGAECVAAGSAARALALIDQAGQPFVAVLLDQHMPGVDGIELARRIRRGRAADVPLVLLSSAAAAAGTEGLFAARLHKPVRPERLVRTLGAVLARGVEPEAARRSSRMPSRPEGGGLRVLVAEDHEVNAQLIELYLRQLGHSCTRVADGQQAVEAVRDGSYDVVLMDAQMPVLGGADATAAIRALPVPQPAIVAVTASVLASDRSAFRAAGADDFLTKPVRLATLAGALDALTDPDLPDLPAIPAGAPVATVPAALDPDTVAELRDLGEDGFQAVYQRFGGLLDSAVTELVAAVDAALGPEQEGSLHRLAHRLKGSSASLGAHRLAALCLRLEDAGRDGAPVADDTLSELRAESDRVGVAVRGLLTFGDPR